MLVVTPTTPKGATMDTFRPDSDYPAALDVDYPDRPLNRLTTFFRVFTIIPIAIVLAAVSGATQIYSGGSGSGKTLIVVGAGGALFAGPLLMILFRQKFRDGGSIGISSSPASRRASRSTPRCSTTGTRPPMSSSR